MAHLRLVPNMNAPDNAVPIYLDQNILSHLRDGKSAREDLAGFLRKLQEKNAVFVYSETHVDECRASSQPEEFIQVMEELPVYFMELENDSDQKNTLSLNKTRSLLLEPEDWTHKAKCLIENFLCIWHFASGWLGEIDAKHLKDEMAAEMAGFWESLQRDIDWNELGTEIGVNAKQALIAAQVEMAATVKNLPFEQTRDEWEIGRANLRGRLPANYAQLDQVPDEEAVAFVHSCLDEQSKKAVESHYPKGFWSRPEQRKTGELAGLAFSLFMCGLVRDKRVRRGKTKSRIQYFRGQFRDGKHIEAASRCAFFVTLDAGAARLARSLYAYSGVNTKVIELSIKASTSQ